MDIYGRGQSVGALVTCYCKKKGIDIDDLVEAIKKEQSMFISGIFEGIGGNRENGKAVSNGILEDMKL